jgi:hypothetical protein
MDTPRAPSTAALARPASRTAGSVVSGAPQPASAPSLEGTASTPTVESDKSVETSDELTLVTAMQLALRSGDAAHVLTLVREHERRFPSSPLAQEREGARALALCAGAGPQEAHRLGQTFLASYPLSPIGERVRVTCGLPAHEKPTR